jgi:acetamidase/formamidase
MRPTAQLLACTLLTAPLFAAEHKLKATPETAVIGHYWSQSKPALRIQPGDIVDIQTVSGVPARLEAAGLAPDLVQPELRAMSKITDRGPAGHILTGPVYIEGAEPGDTLEVRILEIRCDVPYAYNSFRPGSGFLPDDFPYARTKIVPLDLKRNVAKFAPGVEIPLRPFFGSMGVAPPETNGRISSAPPWMHAGNLDNKELVAGTKLFIPVHVKGALFEVGDGHAAQGNGEVDITALETSLSGRFQFIVHKKTIRWPRAETPTHFITMGLHEDLTEAMKLAVRETIQFLVEEKGLAREDAYMLSSVGVDFAVTQVVDGTKGIHAMIPKALFVK